MAPDPPQQEREVRAARNQSLFREVNEKLKALNESVAGLTESFTIACECADIRCIEILELPPQDYLAIRAEPRHFAVLPSHTYPDVERVVREEAGYVVVEKTAAAGEVAAELAPETASD